jgi:predicted nucleic acid-binding protein
VAVIVDTSVLYALVDAADAAHARARHALERETEAIIVPQVTLPEVSYLIGSRLGPRAEADFTRHLAASDWRLEPLTDADLGRVVELLDRYADARLGMVDASIVATAERLGVRRLYTLDRRHFGPIRPAHAAAFELLP